MLCTRMKWMDVLASGYSKEGMIITTNLGAAFSGTPFTETLFFSLAFQIFPGKGPKLGITAHLNLRCVAFHVWCFV